MRGGRNVVLVIASLLTWVKTQCPRTPEVNAEPVMADTAERAGKGNPISCMAVKPPSLYASNTSLTCACICNEGRGRSERGKGLFVIVVGGMCEEKMLSYCHITSHLDR